MNIKEEILYIRADNIRINAYDQAIYDTLLMTIEQFNQEYIDTQFNFNPETGQE